MSRSYIAGVLGVGALALALLLFEAPAPTIAQVQDVINPEPSLGASQVLVGKASWYGPGFDGRPTASGVPYNRRALTAAHRTLRPGTVVRVTNLRNGRSTVLLINDWGPVPEDIQIDVSEAAAEILGFRQQGLAPVRIEVYRAANASL